MHKPVLSVPQNLFKEKFHNSATAGLIHVIHAGDYVGIIKTLLTPAEFMDYLAYREGLIVKWGDYLHDLPEQALLGHYVGGDINERPGIDDSRYLKEIDHKIEQWDISGIIGLFADRIVTTQNPSDYYEVITALAELKRNELAAFKERFVLSKTKARVNAFVTPYRIAYPRLNLGFVFIPITNELIPHRAQALKNFTIAHKYDQQLQRCIGITFAADDSEHYMIDWCFVECPWKYEKEFEDFLLDNNPFRELKTVELARYSAIA